MKKLLCILMATFLLIVSLPVMASEVSGEVVIDNNYNGMAETNPEFYTNKTIAAAATNSTVLNSAINNGLNAIAIASQTTASDAYCQWTPEEGKLSTGKYEVLVYNIVEGSENYKNKDYEAVSDKYAKYTVASKAGDSLNLSSYYIDQGKASGNTNGWVSLGVFSFTGSGDEYVRLDNNWGGGSSSTNTIPSKSSFAVYTYADKVKFVPVLDNNNDATLSHIYATADGTAHETEFAKVEDDVLKVRVPANKTAFEVVLEAASVNASINVTGAASATGTGAVKLTGQPTVGTISQYNVTVSNGTNQKSYTLLVEKEFATQVEIYHDSGLAAYSKGTVVQDGNATANANYNPLKYPTEVDGYIDGGVTLSTTAQVTNTKDYSRGCNVTYTPNTDTLGAGWYNVYGWAASRGLYPNSDLINVAVNHNGLREEKTVHWGRYVGEDAKWVWLGKYYFSGDGNENVIYICPTNGVRMFTFGTKFVKAPQDPVGETLKGFTVSTGTETRSVVTKAFSNGVYYQPLEAGSYNTVNLTVQTANSNYTSIKVNDDSAFVANTARSVSVIDGENVLNIEFVTASGTQNYKLILYKETASNAKTATIVSTGTTAASVGSSTNAYLPVSPEYDDSNIRTITDDENPGYFQPKFTEETAGKYRVIAWKPSFTAVNESDEFGSANQRVEMVLSASSGQSTEISVDWISAPAGWVDLGVYEFANGNTPKVQFYKDGNQVALSTVKFLQTADENFYVSNLEICIGDAAAPELTEGDFVAKGTYYATAGASKPVTVILAKYDNDDKLVDVKVESIISEAGVNSVGTEAITVSDSENEKLKAFVWGNFDNLTPIYTALSLAAGN